MSVTSDPEVTGNVSVMLGALFYIRLLRSQPNCQVLGHLLGWRRYVSTFPIT